MRFHKIPKIVASVIALACGGTDSTAPSAGQPVSSTPATLSSLTITATQSDLDSGQTAVLTALTVAADGRVSNEGTVTWQSSNPEVVSVTSTGNRTAVTKALKAGVAQISAGVSGVSNSIPIAVTSPVPGQNEGTTAAFIFTDPDDKEYIRLPAGANAITANAVNDAGQVTGTLWYPNLPSHVFIWSHASGLTDLGPMPGGGSAAGKAISQNGQVAGWGTGSDGQPHAFRWTSATGFVVLDRPDSYATGINSDGEIVGHVIAPIGYGPFGAYTGMVAYRWSASGVFETLTSIGEEGSASGINDAGQIAGWLGDGDFGYYAAVLWDKSGRRTQVGSSGYAAFAISRNGTITGTTGSAAFVWTAPVGPREIPRGGGDFYNEATGVNDDGNVVGNVFAYEIVGKAYIYHTRGFVATALGGYRLVSAPRGRKQLYLTGINNKGQVVGFVE